MFNVTRQYQGSVISVVPEGRLDTLNSAAFRAELLSAMENQDYLIIDFVKCDYLSSSGIRSLMVAAKELGSRGGGVMLAGLSPEIFQVIEMTGLQSVFPLFSDAGSAADEIRRLQQKENQSSDIQIGDRVFHVEHIQQDNAAMVWQQEQVVSYSELGIAVGIGSPAESLVEDEESRGHFITIGNCAGFLPFDKESSPEFRVVKDPAGAGIFLHWALSFGQQPGSRVRLISPTDLSLSELLESIHQLRQKSDPVKIQAFVITAYDSANASISVGYIAEEGDLQGAKFLLNSLPDIRSGESLTEFAGRALTIENIEGVEPLDLTASLPNPAAWLFSIAERKDAADHQIRVEIPEDCTFEPYKSFLTRRLYTDSARVVVKQLHGGYSAQTFQVDSYDADGRKLRPTVLKVANRAIISREADRCQRYALPYIMNNSAIVLGTAFHCDMGALRYNFVGIGGEQTQLKWLAHYFNCWTADQLEPLFDKIFTQILKPWYGQPVRARIHPYRDHDPTFTFFPKLWETAEKVLAIPSDESFFYLEETGERRTNPYWFLKNEYEARRNQSVEYYTSVCHGDLNMQNILLDKEMNVYLIDFSETKPRSAISDFARLEAIFMIEHAPVETAEEMKEMIGFTTRFYDRTRLDEFPVNDWTGKSPDIMNRNVALTIKMRKYALECVSGETDIVPYYLALLEWMLPVVCYGSASLWHQKLSAYVAGMVCGKIMEVRDSKTSVEF